MKNNFIYTLLFFGVWHLGMAQKFIQANKTLHEIKKEMDTYFEDEKTKKGDEALNAEGSEYNEYRKFINFWEPRLYPHGDFNKYFKAEEMFYNKKNKVKGSGKTLAENDDPWHEIGPTQKPSTTTGGEGTGPIEFITFYDANPNYMLCGSMLGGLFYSTNAGSTWQHTGTDTEWPSTSGCGSAVFHPANYQTWYASSSGQEHNNEASFMRYTGGIWRTTNAGVSWQKIGGQDELGWIWNKIRKLLIDPSNPNVLYAATALGLYKTTNLNAVNPVDVSWTNVLSGEVYDIEMKPNNSSTLYATVESSGTWDFKKSTNSGSSWSSLPNQPSLVASIPPIGSKGFLTIEVSKHDPENLYSIIDVAGNNDLIYLYNNSTWTSITTTNATSMGGGHAFGINQFNENELYVGNGIWSRKIVIGGGNTNMESGYHVDVEDFVCHPANSNEVWMTNHGGVYKSTNNGSSWQDMSNGLGVSQVRKMATSYTSPDYVIAGTYHDGSVITNTPYGTGWAPAWRTLRSCDGERPLIDPTNEQYMWHSCQKGNWSFSDNTGASFSQLPPYSHYFESEAVLNKVNPAILYRVTRIADKDYIVRSFDRGSNYDTITPDFTSVISGILKYEIHKAYTPVNHGDYLYIHVITDKGDTSQAHPETHRVFRTAIVNNVAANVINSWQELPAPRNAWYADMDFDANDPDIIYFTYSSSADPDSETGTGMVLVLDITNQVNRNLTANLPNTGIGNDALVFEKGSDGGMYISTDFGVFYTNNKLRSDGTGWIQLGTGLPHVAGNGLEINYKVNKIRIGTYGRGVWEHNLYCPINYDLTYNAVGLVGFYEAQHDITLTNVQVAGNTTFRAGHKIVFGPGFRGTDFHAFIHPCDDSAPSSFSKKDTDIATSSELENEDKLQATSAEKETMTVFPNPNSGTFEISLSSDLIDPSTSIQIFDVMGKVVYSQDKISQELFKVDLKNQPKGIYLVRVISKEKILTKRVIIN